MNPFVNSNTAKSSLAIQMQCPSCVFLKTSKTSNIAVTFETKQRKSEHVRNCLISQEGYCRYLAKQYALSKDAIANGLPLIDTTKSLVEQYCPPFLMTPKCEVQR